MLGGERGLTLQWTSNAYTGGVVILSADSCYKNQVKLTPGSCRLLSSETPYPHNCMNLNSTYVTEAFGFKGQDQSFGFHIKGGEKRKKRTEQWLVFHYTTPIFISHIVPGGLAERYVQFAYYYYYCCSKLYITGILDTKTSDTAVLRCCCYFKGIHPPEYSYLKVTGRC